MRHKAGKNSKLHAGTHLVDVASPVGVNVEDEDHGTQNQSHGAQNQHGDLPAHSCSHEWSSVILEEFMFAQSQLRFFFIDSEHRHLTCGPDISHSSFCVHQGRTSQYLQNIRDLLWVLVIFLVKFMDFHDIILVLWATWDHVVVCGIKWNKMRLKPSF